jgi:site-specific recombinase XerD
MSVHKKQTKTGIRHQVRWRRSDGSLASKNFRTKKEADAWDAQMKVEKNRGALLDERRGKILFRDLAAKYLENKTHQRHATIRRREGILTKHILPILGDTPINQIRYSDIQSMVNDWVRKGLAPRTIKQHVQVMKPIFEFAVKDDIIVKNPTRGLTLPRVEETQRHALTPEECNALLSTIPDAYHPFIYTLLVTGMRWGEAVDLKIGDLQLLESKLTVRNSKTDAGRREIVLSDLDVTILAHYLEATGRTAADADSPVFLTPEGCQMNSSNFRQRVFKKALKASGLTGVTLHDLRRTHATALVAAGVDLKTIQHRMGHRDIATTLKIYAQVTEAGKAKAAGVMEEYFSSRTASAGLPSTPQSPEEDEGPQVVGL